MVDMYPIRFMRLPVLPGSHAAASLLQAHTPQRFSIGMPTRCPSAHAGERNAGCQPAHACRLLRSRRLTSKTRNTMRAFFRPARCGGVIIFCAAQQHTSDWGWR